ncbi:uncharacterized protein J3R85_016392 [Psidium guajava]|nr:uncharacterized protein J3R85_016392 [Psidium guajava]
MGNLPSCCAQPCPQESVLLDPDGKLWRLRAPVKAAEVMLEASGRIVAPVDEIWRRRRIVAMHADDELVPGKTYLVVLASRMNGKVDEAELMAIESMFRMKRNNNRKRMKKSKGGTLYMAISEGEKNGGGAGGGGGGFQPQLNSYSRRQWNPVLEPILEDN